MMSTTTTTMMAITTKMEAPIRTHPQTGSALLELFLLLAESAARSSCASSESVLRLLEPPWVRVGVALSDHEKLVRKWEDTQA